jgi:hypothetical protein
MDNDMHLVNSDDSPGNGINFEEAKILTNGLCAGLTEGAKKIAEEMKKAVSNPNDTNLSYIARKQVAEWNQKGDDADKIDK